MKLPTKRIIRFHGEYKEKYHAEDLEIHADSVFNLFSILFGEIFPDLKDEKHLSLAFEDEHGEMTEIFDPEQELHDGQKILHIMPNPDGAALLTILYAVIVAIVSIGISLLLAPKMDVNSTTASGSNWETPENVIGQGGTIPVALGTRLIGSRVASYGLDSTILRGIQKSPRQSSQRRGSTSHSVSGCTECRGEQADSSPTSTPARPAHGVCLRCWPC